MGLQDALTLVSSGIVIVLLLVVVVLFFYGQITGHIASRKNERMFNEGLTRLRREELKEWLRERGVN